jgi:hypothetical protein
MTINYGVRNPGALTAASPGDTLYISFQTFNDSGASIAKTGFAVTDIEIFKNGGLTARATDSGYSLISDSGQYADRAGLHRFSVSLFNTADDTGFYDQNSQYHVAIDSIVVDGRTVRFFPAVFEIGTPRANVVAIDGDTGPADNLGRIAADTGTGSYLYREIDTGGIADAVWDKSSRTLTAFAHDTGVAHTVWNTTVRTLTAFAHDTGVAHTVWNTAGRKLAVDTGIAEQVWRSAVATYADTGTFGEALGQGVDLGTAAVAAVNAQVLDVLTVDTFGEPTGVPPATDTLAGKIGRLHMINRNRIDVTATKMTFYDDGDAAEWEKDLTDDGTTYSESEGNAV